MEKKLTPQERYDAANCTRLQLKLNKKTDADILAWLDKQPSKQGSIKTAVRRLISEQSKNK